MAEYEELERYIMGKININDFTTEDDLLEALTNLSRSEYNRILREKPKDKNRNLIPPERAYSISNFGGDQYYEDFNSKIGDRIDVFKEWEKKVDSYFDKTDKATTLDELAQFEKEITDQEWSYRLDEQVKYKRKVLQRQNLEIRDDLLDKIARANEDEYAKIDIRQYKDKLSGKSFDRLKEAMNKRENELLEERQKQ